MFGDLKKEPRLPRQSLNPDCNPPISNPQSTEPSASDIEHSLSSFLSTLRTAGYDLKLEKSIFFRNDKANISDQIFNLIRERAFSVNEGSSLLGILQYRFGANAEVTPELRSTNETTAEIPAIAIESNYIGNNDISIEGHTDFLGKNTLLFKKNYSSPMSDDNKQELVSTISNIYTSKESSFKAFLDGITPQKSKANYVVDFTNNPITDDNIRRLSNFAYHGFSIDISYFSQEGESDRLAKTGALVTPYFFKIDPSVKPPGTIKVKGSIPQVMLNRIIESGVQNKDEAKESINGHPSVEKYTDKYGNVIIREYLEIFGRESPCAREIITVTPPMAIANDSDPSEAIPLKVDLSHFGYGEFPQIISQKPIQGIGTSDGVRLFTNLNPETAKKDFGPKLTRFTAGVTLCEQLFGLPHNSHAQSVYLVNAKNPNAFFCENNPNTIVIQDEILKGNYPPGLLAIHETTHLIDSHTNNKLSSGQIESLYNEISKLNPEFFERLDEGNFIQIGNNAGHSQSNSKELLASLITSLVYSIENPERWRASVKNAGEETYLKLLHALKTNIISCRKEEKPIFPSTSYLLKVIEDRITELSK